jgi:hypothetical protein
LEWQRIREGSKRRKIRSCRRETDEDGSRTKDDDEEDWGTGESKCAIVWIEAIDQAGQHSYDKRKHFFPGAKTMNPCSTQ